MKPTIGLMVASLAAMALAQYPTTVQTFSASYIGDGFLLGKMFASVVDLSPEATTYHFQCANNGSIDCPLPTPGTLVDGPSTADWKFTYAEYYDEQTATISKSLQCKITPSIGATCTVQDNTTFIQTHYMTTAPSISIERGSRVYSRNFTANSNETTRRSMTVTAGMDKLPAPKTTSTETSSGMGAAATAGKGSGMGIAAAAGVAAAAVLL